jgi:16S rRNA (cytosine967-C5)-methyltransferase
LTDARRLAGDVLQAVEQSDVFAEDLLHRAFLRGTLDPRDRALTMELVYGVLRHRASLDWRLSQCVDRPLDQLPLTVWTALRLGAYQLLYLTRVPPSAAVNQAVELVKTLRGRDWSGLVNAVLRSLLRRPAPPFPDIAKEPIQALALRYSCPTWLVERWVSRHGLQHAQALCEATVTIPPLTIRANLLRIPRELLAERLAQAGLVARPTAVSPVGLVLDKMGAVFQIQEFHQGLFYVEDEAAQLVPLILDPQPGERVLDACAAPGGKTTHIAACMNNRGVVVAMDHSADRLRVVAENCRRLGVSIVQSQMMDATALPTSWGAPTFDRVLVDAPCSGLGVLRRQPEGKWRKEAGMLLRHHAKQLRLLESVARVLRPGGVLVYSTCSTEWEETEAVIEAFCEGQPQFVRDSVAPWLPAMARDLVSPTGALCTSPSPFDMDGFFVARLKKASSE